LGDFIHECPRLAGKTETAAASQSPRMTQSGRQSAARLVASAHFRRMLNSLKSKLELMQVKTLVRVRLILDKFSDGYSKSQKGPVSWK